MKFEWNAKVVAVEEGEEQERDLMGLLFRLMLLLLGRSSSKVL
jgi:hypothetical protein